MTVRKYLERTPLAEARSAIIEHAGLTGSELLEPERGLGRVTAAPVFSGFPSPHYRASAMDGVALRAIDTARASKTNPVEFRQATPGASVEDKTPPCRIVDTGSALPDWADAVVRIEDVAVRGDRCAVEVPVSPGRNVRATGEDAEAGVLLLGTGERIRPCDVGAMLATGIQEVQVRLPPRVAVLATGNEVVEPGSLPEPGKVIEFNSRVLSGYVAQWGGESNYLGRVGDVPDTLERSLTDAARNHDVVCIIAGSSVGRRDHTVDVLARCGSVLVHGVDIMPGKPVALGVVADTPVIAVPGYPVSAVVVYLQFLAPLIAAGLGTADPLPPTICAAIRRDIPSRLGVEEFVRVCICTRGTGRVVSPLPRAAGSITTMVRADGLLRVPASCEGLEAGMPARVELLRPEPSIAHGFVVAGKPDRLFAEMSEAARRMDPRFRVAWLGLSLTDSVQAILSDQANGALLRGARGELEQATEALRSSGFEGSLASLRVADPQAGQRDATVVLALCGGRKSTATEGIIAALANDDGLLGRAGLAPSSRRET
ncbi:MAG: molybdopterin-binding protein [Candidatus Binatia bacterium]